ncbi:hypothetical protein [Streptomyces sp. NPDC020817]|uniref:hypothetical protein n=1 Tax=Streptomyces sp. NPDC020817 TaxID=3365095 RepID=UPI0037AA025B
MATKSETHPAEALAEARRKAGELRAQLAGLENDLAQALETRDYRAAENAQTAANGMRPAVLLAEAQVAAYEAATKALSEHQERENAAALQQEKQERAEAARAEAMAGERDAHAEAQKHLEAAQKAVEEAGAALRRAFAAEARETGFRQEIHRIEVEAGWVEPAAFGVGGAQTVQPVIDLSPVLTAIRRSGA